MIRSSLLERVPGLRHGLTTRTDGSLGPAEDQAAREARSAAVRRLGGDPSRLVVPHQVHGRVVAVVDDSFAGRGHGGGAALPATDGAATATGGLPLMAQGADCPLVLLAALDGTAFSVVHSGWRGTVARIASAAVSRLAGLGVPSSELRAAVFPGIGRCCYEVGPEVLGAVADEFGPQSAVWSTPSGRGGHARLDLRAAIAATLEDAGVVAESIEVVAGCTACGGDLWSHRASGGGPERSALVAVLTELNR